MSNSNPYNNESGYGDSGYDSDCDSGSGYEPDGYGAGDTPWQRDIFSDGYQENVFAVNSLDNPYSETALNPNPEADWGQEEQSNSDSSDYDSEMEL